MEFLVYLGIIPEVPKGFERQPTVQITEVNMDDAQLAADIAAAETAAAVADMVTDQGAGPEAALSAATAAANMVTEQAAAAPDAGKALDVGAAVEADAEAARTALQEAAEPMDACTAALDNASLANGHVTDAAQTDKLTAASADTIKVSMKKKIFL